jgi:hypothetical protein
VVKLAAGDAHTCALLDTGVVRCWEQQHGHFAYGNLATIGDDETLATAGFGGALLGAEYRRLRRNAGPAVSAIADARSAALAARLREEPGYLGAALRARAGKRLRRVSVLVDQIEELYTLGADAAERAAFAACLLSAAGDSSSPVRVILTIRSDFLDRVFEDRAFATEVFRGFEPLAPIGRDGLREALIEPLAAAGTGSRAMRYSSASSSGSTTLRSPHHR